MSIKIIPFRSIEALNLLQKSESKSVVKSENKISLKQEFSTANNLHLFAGNLKKTQLFEKLNSLNGITNKINSASAFSFSKIKLGDDDEVIKETKRIFDNYKRKIEPKEIGGAKPVEGSKTSGHARSKHDVKPEVQAEIMNNPERIFSGKNNNGRYVDIYYKNGSAVITEQGDKSRVITAYGKVSTKGKSKPFNLEKITKNPNYVEIKLDKTGSTNVIYPNKERFKTTDFPPGPPKNNPKTNSGGSTLNEPNTAKTTVKPNVQTSEPTITSKSSSAVEDLPKPTSSLGKLSNNLSRGQIIMQLVQIGVAALNYSKLEKDAEKFGFYVDPFLDKYIITNPDKAAKSLGEGFELTFYVNPQDYMNQGESVKFTVKNGKFTNPDGWQLIYNQEKGYTEAVMRA